MRAPSLLQKALRLAFLVNPVPTAILEETFVPPARLESSVFPNPLFVHRALPAMLRSMRANLVAISAAKALSLPLLGRNRATPALQASMLQMKAPHSV